MAELTDPLNQLLEGGADEIGQRIDANGEQSPWGGLGDMLDSFLGKKA